MTSGGGSIGGTSVTAGQASRHLPLTAHRRAEAADLNPAYHCARIGGAEQCHPRLAFRMNRPAEVPLHGAV